VTIAAAEAEVENQSELIQPLRQEICDLKALRDPPFIAAEIIDIKEDFKWLLASHSRETLIVYSVADATFAVPTRLRKAQGDPVVWQAEAFASVEVAFKRVPDSHLIVTQFRNAALLLWGISQTTFATRFSTLSLSRLKSS
jgi:hypothetical protein